jgi:hypothetical protein
MYQEDKLVRSSWFEVADCDPYALCVYAHPKDFPVMKNNILFNRKQKKTYAVPHKNVSKHGMLMCTTNCTGQNPPGLCLLQI